MKSEDVIVKSEGTLHTSPLISRLNYCLLHFGFSLVFKPESDRVHYTHFRSGDLEMLCWVYVADGVRAGRCAVLAATAWAPSIEERSEVVGVMVYHHWSSKPFCASSQGTLVAC